ncbi:hypothetical protein DL93DRAFT_2153685 [Clavulina sp. PMI_390]|nr:hypothetical protein DL93DRAFT_2153685 [Clavulina sp. PMI_390]
MSSTPLEKQGEMMETGGSPTKRRKGMGAQPKGWVAPMLSTPAAVVLCVLLVAVAMALELVLWGSKKHNGFASFSSTGPDANKAAQFLKSFVPILVFIPIVFAMRSAYDALREVQPYVDLAHGSSQAHNSITLPYMAQSPFEVLPASVSRRHWVLVATSLVLVWSTFFSSLAGSLFTVQLSTVNATVAVISAGNIGNNTDAYRTPASFISAAGGTDFIIYSAESLPAYTFKANGGVTDGWTAINAPTSSGTSSLFYETEAIHVQVQCASATVSGLTAGAAGAYAFNATLSPNCWENFTGTLPTDFTSWFGFMGDASPSCINAINPNISVPTNLTAQQDPVAISFIANRTAASSAFCFATQAVFSALAEYDIGGNRLGQLTNLKLVANHPINGFTANGLRFSDPTTMGVIANAIGYTIADAVISDVGKNTTIASVNETVRDQTLSNGGAALVRSVENAFLIYLLSLAGRIFVQDTPIYGEGTSVTQQARIHAFAPTIHVLAVLCLLSAVLFAFAFILHARERRPLYLAGPPSASIGSVAAMLSERSQFMTLLSPYNTPQDINRKLKGKTFSLNPHTGKVELHHETQVNGFEDASKPEGLDALPHLEVLPAAFPA